MGAPESEHIFGIQLRESADDGSDFSNADADYRKLFLGEDGDLHLKDSSGTVTDIGGSSGTTITGMIPIMPAPGFRLSPSATDNTASRGLACPMVIPGTMRLRNLVIRVTVTGAGTHEWGLFDYSSNAAACTKLAGGSGALGSTGWTAIAASGAPVTINPGNYMLIFKWPAATAATISVSDSSVANKLGKVQGSYVWDDTPDLTSGWSDHTSVIVAYLHGDLNSSATW